MGANTPMAISAYLGFFILGMFLYPFILVGISASIYDKPTRKRVLIRFNIGWLLLLAILLTMHMQIDIFYGSELYEMLEIGTPN